MVVFFKKGSTCFYAVDTVHPFTDTEKQKLSWLFDGARPLSARSIKGTFVGPRREMITPWSTNAVEITQNMGIDGIVRIEQFERTADSPAFDPMLQHVYHGLDSSVFKIDRKPDPIVHIDDIHSYNLSEGLALSPDEENYLSQLSARLGRPLTDSEVFGFSQVNSEHCRHKIFNGTFVIDGKEMPDSLFSLIRKTSRVNKNGLVSAYKDNVAFVSGPRVQQFAPDTPQTSGYFA